MGLIFAQKLGAAVEGEEDANQVGLAGNAQLGVHLADMPAHAVLAQLRGGCDARHRVSLRQQRGDVALRAAQAQRGLKELRVNGGRADCVEKQRQSVILVAAP